MNDPIFTEAAELLEEAKKSFKAYLNSDHGEAEGAEFRRALNELYVLSRKRNKSIDWASLVVQPIPAP